MKYILVHSKNFYTMKCFVKVQGKWIHHKPVTYSVKNRVHLDLKTIKFVCGDRSGDVTCSCSAHRPHLLRPQLSHIFYATCKYRHPSEQAPNRTQNKFCYDVLLRGAVHDVLLQVWTGLNSCCDGQKIPCIWYNPSTQVGTSYTACASGTDNISTYFYFHVVRFHLATFWVVVILSHWKQLQRFFSFGSTAQRGVRAA
jgi:hypothetical protein